MSFKWVVVSFNRKELKCVQPSRKFIYSHSADEFLSNLKEVSRICEITNISYSNGEMGMKTVVEKAR
jgi:hypothetical protein